MSDEIEDPDRAVDRLEAALERIAALSRARSGSEQVVDAVPAEVDLDAVSARLGALIERLRAGLAGRQD